MTLAEYNEKRSNLKKLIAQQKELVDKHSTTDSGGVKHFGDKLGSAQLKEFNDRNDEINKIAKELEDGKKELDLGQQERNWATMIALLDDPANLKALGLASPFMMAPSVPDPAISVKSIHKDIIDQMAAMNMKGFRVGTSMVLNDSTDPALLRDYLETSEGRDHIKNVMVATGTTYGFPYFKPRLDRIEFSLQRRIMLMNLIPQIAVDWAGATYMHEDLFTNNAAFVAENALKPTSTLHYEELTITIQTIAHLMKMTEQQVSDVPGFAQLIELRGTYMLDLVWEQASLTGDGNSPNIQGINTMSGINTRAKGSDSIPDVIYRVMQDVRVNGLAEPDAVVMYPDDWTEVRLLKTADGIYIWGSPSEAGPERLWGKQVIQTAAQTSGKATIGDFGAHCVQYLKGGMGISWTNSNEDDFKYNRLMARLERRVAQVIFRAKAFGTATSLNS